MPLPELTVKVSLETLERKYWEEAGFCISCLKFSGNGENILLESECPYCLKNTLYGVDYLIRKEILVSID